VAKVSIRPVSAIFSGSTDDYSSTIFSSGNLTLFSLIIILFTGPNKQFWIITHLKGGLISKEMCQIPTVSFQVNK
jgi:hypothetical protein